MDIIQPYPLSDEREIGGLEGRPAESSSQARVF